MNKNGEIIIIEDDEDDRAIFSAILNELNYGNKIVFLNDAFDALDYLKQTSSRPFLILSDINMPKMSGFELRNKIFSDPDLKDKCIPYIFFTTSSSPASIMEAYQMSIQGYFQKADSYESYRKTLARIIDYWKESMTPAPN